MSTREGRTPSIGTVAVSLHINKGRLSPSVSNLPITTCRHLDSMTVFSAAFMSQFVACEVVISLPGLCVTFLYSLEPPEGWVGGCAPLYPGERLKVCLPRGWSNIHLRPFRGVG